MPKSLLSHFLAPARCRPHKSVLNEHSMRMSIAFEALRNLTSLGALRGGETWVERFDRRGIEPFELFRSEFGQNSFKIQEFSVESSKISEILKFQHFLNYRRNSDKISSNSGQKSIKKKRFLQKNCQKMRKNDEHFLKY